MALSSWKIAKLSFKFYFSNEKISPSIMLEAGKIFHYFILSFLARENLGIALLPLRQRL
jgi:hypothetical protein